MQKAKVRENVKEYALLTLGTVIMTLGIYFFKFPNHFSTGGVSGMAVILSHYIPNFTNGDFVMMITSCCSSSATLCSARASADARRMSAC